ncbi:MAG: prepilin-type N-terminal cleavage/methylation domain-containing protein [Rhodoferax sp.]
MMAARPVLRTRRGFTLIEVVVALAVLALMAVLGWRAIDGMVRSQEGTQRHQDDVYTLDAALGQWQADWDALLELPHTQALDWDGRVLRLTRRHPSDPGAGALVVAWSSADRGNGAHWLRWQSAPVQTRLQWQQAWEAAAQWGHNPGETLRRAEVKLLPLQQWQLYYFRGGAWSNPLSASGADTEPARTAASAPQPQPSADPLPDGVRLVLQVAPPHALAGSITRDWARPVTLSGATP